MSAWKTRGRQKKEVAESAIRQLRNSQRQDLARKQTTTQCESSQVRFVCRRSKCTNMVAIAQASTEESLHIILIILCIHAFHAHLYQRKKSNPDENKWKWLNLCSGTTSSWRIRLRSRGGVMIAKNLEFFRLVLWYGEAFTERMKLWVKRGQDGAERKISYLSYFHSEPSLLLNIDFTALLLLCLKHELAIHMEAWKIPMIRKEGKRGAKKRRRRKETERMKLKLTIMTNRIEFLPPCHPPPLLTLDKCASLSTLSQTDTHLLVGFV